MPRLSIFRLYNVHIDSLSICIHKEGDAGIHVSKADICIRRYK